MIITKGKGPARQLFLRFCKPFRPLQSQRALEALAHLVVVNVFKVKVGADLTSCSTVCCEPDLNPSCVELQLRPRTSLFDEVSVVQVPGQ